MLLIKANIAMFNHQLFLESPLVHYLVDCPGLEYVKSDTERYTTVVSAVIYAQNYRRFLHDPKKIEQDLKDRPRNGRKMTFNYGKMVLLYA